jgi:anaerobic magnesium-protoporphyrin IX monomethyl ester cyclase
MFFEVERICNIIRAVVPGATIILGGSLPSPIPEFALRQTKADICTIGEAEITIVDLMKSLAGEVELSDVKGISYIKDGEYFSNGVPMLPAAVTKKEVGWPAWDAYPVESYLTSPRFHPFEQHDRIESTANTYDTSGRS